MGPRKTARSSSRKKMEEKLLPYREGEEVLAKWPGTSLYFQAKVNYVRDDDEEYDVQYEDGTIYTMKAKDVRKNMGLKKSTSSRSVSRGRSPSRSRGRKPKVQSTPKSTRSTSAKRQAESSAKPNPAVSRRQSARIAAKEVELDDDKEEGKSADLSAVEKSSGFKESVFDSLSKLSFEWIAALVFAVLGPFILVSLHTLCTAKSCKLSLPFDKIPKTLKAYWDPYSFLFVVGFALAGKLMHRLPFGAVVQSASTKNVRMNGFGTLLLMLALVPALVYQKVPLSFVTDRYFNLLTSCLLYSVVTAFGARIKARLSPEKRTINPKGDTGNLIVDVCNGRELNPFIAGSDGKLELFRFSMTGLAMLNVVMVINSIMGKGGEVNPVVILASSLQVLYALDALFFEEYFFLSHDSMNSGFGLHLISSYLTFPFVPTLVTQYLIERSPVMKWYYLVSIAALNAVGYVMFRASETQRCEFAKDPYSSTVRHLETSATVRGKKLLVSGWWGIVRHPNYLGEIIVQWSWVLPAVCTAGRTDLLVYYLPVMTTLMLIFRCSQQNAKNKRKYGTVWNDYCEKVTGNLIPKVF